MDDMRLNTAGLLTALVITASTTALGACGADETPVVDQAQSGSEIELAAGQDFEIHLESNPSTGFAWEISAMTGPDLVALDSRTHLPADSTLVGAPGTDVFVFTAGAEGAGILRLEYIKASDDPVIPERVVEFIIRIDGAEWPPTGERPPPTSTAVAPED